jgi:hypothetical protein
MPENISSTIRRRQSVVHPRTPGLAALSKEKGHDIEEHFYRGRARWRAGATA